MEERILSGTDRTQAACAPAAPVAPKAYQSRSQSRFQSKFRGRLWRRLQSKCGAGAWPLTLNDSNGWVRAPVAPKVLMPR